jgi:hypothetical protein
MFNNSHCRQTATYNNDDDNNTLCISTIFLTNLFSYLVSFGSHFSAGSNVELICSNIIVFE